MGHFPFFMEIGGKKGVILGGGRVAARKVEKLLPFGPVLTCIAPAAVPFGGGFDFCLQGSL